MPRVAKANPAPKTGRTSLPLGVEAAAKQNQREGDNTERLSRERIVKRDAPCSLRARQHPNREEQEQRGHAKP